MAQESSRAWKDQYMLRLPDGMRDRIKAAAEANNRSMNAEIVARLETTFELDAYTPSKNAWLDDAGSDLLGELSRLVRKYSGE